MTLFCRFEWDLAKAKGNVSKHGVSFEEAATCFRDRMALEVFDSAHAVVEGRFILVGRSQQGRVLVVAFALRSQSTIRIISARAATRKEREKYEAQATQS